MKPPAPPEEHPQALMEALAERLERLEEALAEIRRPHLPCASGSWHMWQAVGPLPPHWPRVRWCKHCDLVEACAYLDGVWSPAYLSWPSVLR